MIITVYSYCGEWVSSSSTERPHKEMLKGRTENPVPPSPEQL